MRINTIDSLGLLVGASAATWAAFWIGDRSTVGVALLSWPIVCFAVKYVACFPIAVGFALWFRLRSPGENPR